MNFIENSNNSPKFSQSCEGQGRPVKEQTIEKNHLSVDGNNDFLHMCVQEEKFSQLRQISFVLPSSDVLVSRHIGHDHWD